MRRRRAWRGPAWRAGHRFVSGGSGPLSSRFTRMEPVRRRAARLERRLRSGATRARRAGCRTTQVSISTIVLECASCSPRSTPPWMRSTAKSIRRLACGGVRARAPTVTVSNPASGECGNDKAALPGGGRRRRASAAASSRRNGRNAGRAPRPDRGWARQRHRAPRAWSGPATVTRPISTISPGRDLGICSGPEGWSATPSPALPMREMRRPDCRPAFSSAGAAALTPRCRPRPGVPDRAARAAA